uniref:Uncharacterized protein n=1 Tax=Cacopsylla melanoneura TaxID=428564 RepID=A0A8D8YVP1_9HEMI
MRLVRTMSSYEVLSIATRALFQKATSQFPRSALCPIEAEGPLPAAGSMTPEVLWTAGGPLTAGEPLTADGSLTAGKILTGEEPTPAEYLLTAGGLLTSEGPKRRPTNT